MCDIILWLAVIIFVEAIIEIIITSEILFPVRNWITKLNPSFLGKLFGCGYCMSVWVSFQVAWMLPGNIFGLLSSSISFVIIDYVVRAIVLHRLSNVWHELLSRFFKRLPWHVVVSRDVFDAPSDEVNDGK